MIVFLSRDLVEFSSKDLELLKLSLEFYILEITSYWFLTKKSIPCLQIHVALYIIYISCVGPSLFTTNSQNIKRDGKTVIIVKQTSSPLNIVRDTKSAAFI